jgi:hypothetical protein
MVTGIRAVPAQPDESVRCLDSHRWRDTILAFMKPTLIAVLFLFMRAMVTPSAAIFLVPPRIPVAAMPVSGWIWRARALGRGLLGPNRGGGAGRDGGNPACDPARGTRRTLRRVTRRSEVRQEGIVDSHPADERRRHSFQRLRRA